jgi:hypothetical protein
MLVKPPWNRDWQFDRPLVAVRPPGPILPARNLFLQTKFLQRFQPIQNLETTQKSLWTKEKNGGVHSKFWTTFSKE